MDNQIVVDALKEGVLAMREANQLIAQLKAELLEAKLERNFLNFQLIVNGIKPWI